MSQDIPSGSSLIFVTTGPTWVLVALCNTFLDFSWLNVQEMICRLSQAQRDYILHGGQEGLQIPSSSPRNKIQECPNLNSEPERSSCSPASEAPDLYICPNVHPLFCLAFAKIRNTHLGTP